MVEATLDQSYFVVFTHVDERSTENEWRITDLASEPDVYMQEQDSVLERALLLRNKGSDISVEMSGAVRAVEADEHDAKRVEWRSLRGGSYIVRIVRQAMVRNKQSEDQEGVRLYLNFKHQRGSENAFSMGPC